MKDETMDMSDMQIPVLIVGGALVGLAASLFLSWQGIRSLVVERHPEPARLPRARGYNARTLELFRLVGLEEAIRAVWSPMAENRGIVRVESLAGHEFVGLDEGGQGDLSAFSPTTGCIIGQEHLEPMLAEYAQKLDGIIHFNTELLSFEQDETGVSALVRERETGRERCVRARYLLAADGSHSGIRETLGIQTRGPGTISHSIDVAFEADLHEATHGRHFYIYFVNNPRLPDGQAGLMPLDNQSRWSFGTPIHPERGERLEDLTDERCIELIRIATGVPDLDVKILSAYPWSPIKVGLYELAAKYVERYQQGRVFLAGDAAHTVLPTGGLGAGTGIQDVFNLAWKLALVLKGQAGTALLDTYEEERVPIGKLVVEQTLQRYFYRTGTGEYQLIDDAELIFGFRYRSAALDVEPHAHSAPLTQHPATLQGEPGTRAPHVVLEYHGSSISTIDLCAGRWALLTGAQGHDWIEAARQAAPRLNLELSTYAIGGVDGPQDSAGLWSKTYGVDATGAVLVRPDGFVAWRSPGRAQNPQAVLEHTVAQLLCRN